VGSDLIIENEMQVTIAEYLVLENKLHKQFVRIVLIASIKINSTKQSRRN
jgi:hypothetical protein